MPRSSRVSQGFAAFVAVLGPRFDFGYVGALTDRMGVWGLGFQCNLKA